VSKSDCCCCCFFGISLDSSTVSTGGEGVVIVGVMTGEVTEEEADEEEASLLGLGWRRLMGM